MLVVLPILNIYSYVLAVALFKVLRLSRSTFYPVHDFSRSTFYTVAPRLFATVTDVVKKFCLRPAFLVLVCQFLSRFDSLFVCKL